MTTEQYSIGYDAGYQDGFDAALAEPVKQKPVGQLQENAFGRGQVIWFNKPADETLLYAAPVSAEPCKECDAKQAKIDSLMLEYCPDEITDEQMTEWSANQKPVSECRHCGWLCMPNDSHSKKWYPMQEPVKQEPVAWGYFDADGTFMDALDRQHGAYQTPLYAAPVSAKAIRAEALEEAAKVCEAKQSYNAMHANTEFAAGIRGLK